MTVSTINRIARLYRDTIGYDPIKEGWTPREAIENLRDYRTECKRNA